MIKKQRKMKQMINKDETNDKEVNDKEVNDKTNSPMYSHNHTNWNPVNFLFLW